MNAVIHVRSLMYLDEEQQIHTCYGTDITLDVPVYNGKDVDDNIRESIHAYFIEKHNLKIEVIALELKATNPKYCVN